VNLAGVLIWTGEFDEGERWLCRTAAALETDTGLLVRLLLHMATGMLMSGRRLQHEALGEYRAAEHLQAQLAGSHALARQLTSFRLATQARLGQFSEARMSLAALDDGLARSAEIGNARAAICLAEGDPAGALAAIHDVLDDIAPAIGYVTLVEANLLAALAHRELRDQRAAAAATESALALAEADRLVLPFAMTGRHWGCSTPYRHMRLPMRPWSPTSPRSSGDRHQRLTASCRLPRSNRSARASCEF